MVPALIGPHYPAECQHCQQSWQIAAETYRESQPVVCPVCQSKQTAIGHLVPGETVEMSRHKRPTSALQVNRLDCVIFSDNPQANYQDSSQGKEVLNTQSWTCKRVWGLPGDDVALRHGQFYINGKIWQKSLAELLQIAIPVSDFPNDSASYWQHHHPKGSVRTAHRHNTLTLEIDWQLTWSYQSGLLVSNQSDPVLRVSNQSHPVWDDYWWNQSTPRSLLPVDDLLLTVYFQTPSSKSADSGRPGHLVIQCSYMGESCSVECRFDNQNLAKTDSTASEAVNPQRLHIGGWDGRMWAQWDTEPAVLLKSCDISALSLESDSTQTVGSPASAEMIGTTGFTIRTIEGTVQINRLTVQRDLYLRYNERAPQNGRPESTKLGSAEFYVIGDNLPISVDSRNGLGTVKLEQIVGILNEPRDH